MCYNAIVCNKPSPIQSYIGMEGAPHYPHESKCCSISGMFDILNTKRDCGDDDEHQDAATIDDKINGANLDESGSRNPRNVMGSPEMESCSGIDGREAYFLCQVEAKHEK